MLRDIVLRDLDHPRNPGPLKRGCRPRGDNRDRLASWSVRSWNGNINPEDYITRVIFLRNPSCNYLQILQLPAISAKNPPPHAFRPYGQLSPTH
jgi:hypothetical protein